MRPAQKSNRSRGRGNRKSGGGGGNNINRVYDSAGPEGKVRGTPQQIIDKYTSLARDAQTSGDRVAAENFLQHAEHYQRILIQAMGAQEQNRREQDAQQSDGGGDQNRNDRSDQQQSGGEQPAPAAVIETDAPEAVVLAASAAADGEAKGNIGGMAMIDSGPAADDLLVAGEEVSHSQPRKNGAGRGRKPKAEKPEGAPIEPAPSGDADPSSANAEN